MAQLPDYTRQKALAEVHRRTQAGRSRRWVNDDVFKKFELERWLTLEQFNEIVREELAKKKEDSFLTESP